MDGLYERQKSKEVDKENQCRIPLDDNMVSVQWMRPFIVIMLIQILRISKLDFSHFELQADNLLR